MKIKKRELRVLRALGSYGGEVDLAEIAKHLKGTVSKAKASACLARLHQEGLAWRNADIYRITDAGKQALG